tara:strand:+ start:3638 stop:3871 length:234 start_codon:yes stop_codon:yes gene_type:complete
MIFKQNKKDGSCVLEFSKKEIKIINKTKGIYFDEKSLKHFGNTLVHMVAQWQLHFSEDVSNLLTNPLKDKVEGKENV